MKNILKLEEAAMFVASIYGFNLLGYAWWVYAALILTPDIGMLGYLVNKKVGAITYNIFHHKALAIVVAALGLLLCNNPLLLAGIILFGHAAMDRMMGYGLKFYTGFKHTHLGELK